jgi:hypothetical protein
MKRRDKAKLGLTNVPTDAPLTPQQQLVADYIACFSTEAGKAVLNDLQRFQRRGSFVPDSNVTAFHEGQREIVRMIENFLDADPLTTAVVDNEEIR